MDVDFIRISVLPHKFGTKGSAVWDVSFIRISILPQKLMGLGSAVWNVDFIRIIWIEGSGVGGCDLGFFAI